MKVLELFSGTGSVKKVCDKLEWDSVSVDMILPADHQIDIMDFDYKQYPKDYFDIVWASPPCTNYSALKNCWFNRKLKDGTIYTKEQNLKEQDEADKLVLKSFEIIEYFNPKLWFLENPQTGNLKNREIMKDKPFYDVDYCMYSDWGYKKRTRIWTNKKEFNNKLCDGSGACGNMIEVPTNGAKRHDTGKPIKTDTRKLHTSNCGKSESLRAVKNHKIHQINLGNADNNLRKNLQGSQTKLDRYRVPEQLIMDLFLN
tara:strand:+ start:1438 stop:2208 length:771 start_codon:yes stop_codon:yes gene_type:complete